MKLQLNPQAYRNPKVYKDFEIADLMILVFGGMFFPMLSFFVLRLPLYMSMPLIWPPILIYFFKFRSGKPKGYFHHWLRYKFRPLHWVSNPSGHKIHGFFPQVFNSPRYSKEDYNYRRRHGSR